AELLRIKGDLLLQSGAKGAQDEAEVCFRQALHLANTQTALAWELRAATSFARMLCDSGRAADAISVVRPVYNRFTEGFDTTDLKAAQIVMDLCDARVRLG